MLEYVINRPMYLCNLTCVFLGGKSLKKWRGQVVEFKNLFVSQVF